MIRLPRCERIGAVESSPKGLATVALVAGLSGLYWSIYASPNSLIELVDRVEPGPEWFVPLVWMLLFGLLTTGGLAISKKPRSRPTLSVGVGAVPGHEDKRGEQELLEAIERHGEITPVRALETSLTVAEADRMLSELAKGGYLEVRVEGGKLLYCL